MQCSIKKRGVLLLPLVLWSLGLGISCSGLSGNSLDPPPSQLTDSDTSHNSPPLSIPAPVSQTGLTELNTTGPADCNANVIFQVELQIENIPNPCTQDPDSAMRDNPRVMVTPVVGTPIDTPPRKGYETRCEENGRWSTEELAFTGPSDEDGNCLIFLKAHATFENRGETLSGTIQNVTGFTSDEPREISLDLP